MQSIPHPAFAFFSPGPRPAPRTTVISSTMPDVRNGAHSIEQRGRALRQRHDWRQRLDASLNHGTPNVFVGAIAAGEKVVASKRAATAKFLSKSYSDTLAVEMEGRGFLEGVHLNPPVEGSVIRGISDRRLFVSAHSGGQIAPYPAKAVQRSI